MMIFRIMMFLIGMFKEMRHCLKIALLGLILIPRVRESFRNNVFSDITDYFWFSALLSLIAKALQ